MKKSKHIKRQSHHMKHQSHHMKHQSSYNDDSSVIDESHEYKHHSDNKKNNNKHIKFSKSENSYKKHLTIIVEKLNDKQNKYNELYNYIKDINDEHANKLLYIINVIR